MDITQNAGDNSVIVGVNFGNISVTYNSKVVLSPAEIQMKILQIDELLNQVRPKSVFDALGKVIFSFVLSAGILYCLSLMIVFVVLMGANNGGSTGAFLNILFFVTPIVAIGITIWRHASENEKINEKRKLLEKIKGLYEMDLHKHK